MSAPNRTALDPASDPMTKRRLTEAVRDADERVTSFHEAGHGCASVELKIKFTLIDIIPNEIEGSLGRIHWPDDKFWCLLQDGHHQDPTVINWVERRMVASFAGAAAQRRYAPRSNWRYGGSADRKSADKWIQKLIAGPSNYEGDTPPWGRERDDYYDDETNDFFGDIEPKPDDNAHWYTPDRLLDRKTLDVHHAKYRVRAEALVRELWPEIRCVARALLKHKTLTESQVRRLMNRTRRLR
jgi:hypothetical protein